MTDARGPQPQYEPFSAGPLPGERPAQPPAQPYHPPQAYTPPASAPSAPSAPGTAASASSAPGASGAREGARRSVPAPSGRATARRPKPAAAPRTGPRVRKARLRVAKIDPWSVMKVSFLLAIALGICTVVASAVLWTVMDAMGVFSTVGGTISEATESKKGSGFDLESFLSLPRVMGFTTIIALINVVLVTSLATLGAFIYNISAGFVGGVEVTLAEDD
ncbi:DUF3566 domain-containing protein [Streptomyces palmae]|uniref:DUF3566 domain-containing protein n=1 Tax=Streptomyces palmae TaxID=1701085 RepID=A0A4Z0HIA5_9ACTN|nr:DUF3566 domain-containing protein [Streptomyces palmae]TGB17464.1 hypothetical protein E4099_03350 [Streptomyces palmae]